MRCQTLLDKPSSSTLECLLRVNPTRTEIRSSLHIGMLPTISQKCSTGNLLVQKSPKYLFFFLLTSSNRQLCEEKELELQNEKQKNKQNVQPWHYSATPPTAACAPLAPIPTR